MKFTTGVIIFIVILALIFGPLLFIWALNTLFGLTIAFTLKTWFAALIIGGAVRGNVRSSSK